VAGQYIGSRGPKKELPPEAKRLLGEIEAKGRRLVADAEAVDVSKETGRAYEARWRIETQFHRFPETAARARDARTALTARIPARDLYRARADWFRKRQPAASDGEADPAEPGTRSETNPAPSGKRGASRFMESGSGPPPHPRAR
jgi:hypothetical protein